MLLKIQNVNIVKITLQDSKMQNTPFTNFSMNYFVMCQV